MVKGLCARQLDVWHGTVAEYIRVLSWLERRLILGF